MRLPPYILALAVLLIVTPGAVADAAIDTTTTTTSCPIEFPPCEENETGIIIDVCGIPLGACIGW